MTRSTVRSRPCLQLVLQGEARQLKQRLDLSHIAYETVDQPGPLTMRVAVADWDLIRAIAAERGYGRPDFYSQSDAGGADPFTLFWLHQRPARAR